MNRSTLLGSAFIALGLIVGGWLLGSEIKDVRLADRYVTVRGLAERNVNANLAIWPIAFREAGNDLATTYAKSEQDNAAVLKFLAAQGIPSADITQAQPSVTDTQANDFGGNRNPYRYIVQQSVTVRTPQVERVAAAVQKASALIAQGVVLGGGPGMANSVSYVYTALNSIKPAMITEATHNARLAAERFAADSGSQVGAIREASQGLFAITSADAPSEGGGYAGPQPSTILQKVRVVTTIQYYLDR